MKEEGNETMLEACIPPKTSFLATAIFSALDSYVFEAANIVGGMGISFLGVDRTKVIKNAKLFRNINLVRYEPYLDMYINELRKLYNNKEKKSDG